MSLFGFLQIEPLGNLLNIENRLWYALDRIIIVCVFGRAFECLQRIA